MNSHARRSQVFESQTDHLELTGILNISQEGQEFQPEGLEVLRHTTYEPVQLKGVEDGYADTNGGRRSGPRYGLRVTVLICNHIKAFRTQTENVSFSGLLMKDHLPEVFHRGFFDIVFITESAPGQKKYLLFKGKAVHGGQPSRRVAFEGFGSDAQKRLSELVADLTQC